MVDCARLNKVDRLEGKPNRWYKTEDLKAALRRAGREQRDYSTYISYNNFFENIGVNDGLCIKADVRNDNRFMSVKSKLLCSGDLGCLIREDIPVTISYGGHFQQKKVGKDAKGVNIPKISPFRCITKPLTNHPTSEKCEKASIEITKAFWITLGGKFSPSWVLKSPGEKLGLAAREFLKGK